MFGRAGFLFCAIVLILMLSTGSLFHAVTPHMHSHDEGGATSSIWDGLHGALRGEEKKVLLAITTAFAFFAAAPVVAQFSYVFFLTPLYATVGTRPPTLLEALRRGNLPYRKFT